MLKLTEAEARAEARKHLAADAVLCLLYPLCGTSGRQSCPQEAGQVELPGVPGVFTETQLDSALFLLAQNGVEHNNFE